MIVFVFIACKNSDKAKKTVLSDVINNKVLQAVGVKKIKPPERFYHPDLIGFANNFISDAARYGVIITDQSKELLRVINFSDKLDTTETGVLASCNRYRGENQAFGGVIEVRWNTIQVLKDATKRYTGESHILLRELLYHELYHCLLNKGHLPEDVPGIMNPFFQRGDQRAFKDWDGLIADMFSKKLRDMTPDAP